MLRVYPDYYKDFRCIAGACKHSCCIGWEIDIDPDTLDFYDNVGGDFGRRLKCGIDKTDSPHFILGESERCPFLNKENLCDIIINLGSEHLCHICREHARFINELPDRTEIGLGLTCEAAARLILGKKEPFSLVGNGDLSTDDALIHLRDNILEVLQQRDFSVFERAENMLLMLGTYLPEKTIAEWADILLDLERLDEKWTDVLMLIKNSGYTCFSELKSTRFETEYEQLLCYFIYRHFANAFDTNEAVPRAKLGALCFYIILTAENCIRNKIGNFDFEELAELCRMLSSEIEYSDENLDRLLDILYE